jgi:hypothetical protein
VTAEAWRVAQIVVDRGPGGDGWRGSGYLVGPGLVLTAAHVVGGASAVRVRLDVGQPDEVEVQADGWWADPKGRLGTDLAVLVIATNATAGRDTEPARFGQIGDGMAVLAVEAFGFPLFKLRTSPVDGGEAGVFRDLEQVTGHAPVAANRRQGTLAVYLDDPPPASPEPGGPSPWAGMSGAAVWAGGRIIAVVAEHHPGEGTGRLTARRIDRAYDLLPEPDLGQLAHWLGLAEAGGGLPDVVPARPGQLVRSAYLEQVRDIAPDVLIGRDGELAEWAGFGAGPDAYAWWQAGPWAGKTALASWFVTHPPAGVDVASFFVTGRLASQADSDAFLDAMIEQLHALSPASGGPASVTGARVGTWLTLLASAAAQAVEQGRRLIVVVDGLDEDKAGASPAGGRPSIASLLPRRPPSSVRIIVTSRPDPGLPDDVPSGHPLRICIPGQLAVSQVAKDLSLVAKQELHALLRGDQMGIDVVGYIAASGGGLTRTDLEALTGALPMKLDPILRGVSGRSLQTRAPAESDDASADPATRVYLFAHETLRVTAEEQLGTGLARYRQRIHDWIRSYARGGWPDTTPGYAIRGYPALLTTTSDTSRLSALARDPRRHAFLMRVTGSDYAAVAEIRTAQGVIAAQKVPDLRALVELAVFRYSISIRNQSIPANLPVVWARLARFDHAEALARSITSPVDKAWALGALASTAAEAGDPDRASRLAAEAETRVRDIIDPSSQARALTWLVAAVVRAGDPDRAEALARDITNLYYQTLALAAVAGAVAQTGDPDRASGLAAQAETQARDITDPSYQAHVLAALARAAAWAGDPDRAEALARDITDPYSRALALAGLVGAVAQTGDPDRASGLAAQAETLARTITDPSYQAQVLAALARAAARAGDPDRAEAVARDITHPGIQVQTLAEVASTVAQTGDPDRASRLATQAETLARTITDPSAQARALAEMASAAARAGDPDRASGLVTQAETLARDITNPNAQAQVLTELARAVAWAGDPDRAETLARDITNPNARARALAEVARAVARVGDPDRAETLARDITDPSSQAQTLAGLAQAAAQAGDPDRAETLARDITDPYLQVQALTEIARAAARAGDPDRPSRLAAKAEALVRDITDPSSQAQALAAMVGVVAQAGDPDRASRLAAKAEALARDITDPSFQARALAEIASAADQAGDPDRASRLAAEAETLARDITTPLSQSWALARVAWAAAQGGDLDRAETLARDITDPYIQVQALTDVARAVARIGDLDRAETLARTITNPDAQARALAELACAAARAGHPDRARHLLALTLSVESPEIRWWTEAVSQLFPSAIRGAGDVLSQAMSSICETRSDLYAPAGQSAPTFSLCHAAVTPCCKGGDRAWRTCGSTGQVLRRLLRE